jgi:hypothetical protein
LTHQQQELGSDVWCITRRRRNVTEETLLTMTALENSDLISFDVPLAG